MEKKRSEPLSVDIADRLVSMAGFIERQEQVDEALYELVRLAAAALQAGRCSIMLLKHKEGTKQFRLKVSSHIGHLPESAVSQETPLDETIAGHVVMTGQALCIEDIDCSPFAPKARRPSAGSASFLSAPILMQESVAGVINFSEPQGRAAFTGADLVIAKLTGLLVGRSLQVVQLQNLLKSRYLHFAISQESAPFQDGTITLDGKNTAEMAKILSRTFYREMTRAGFGADEILGAATEIISLLSERVSRLRTRQDSATSQST